MLSFNDADSFIFASLDWLCLYIQPLGVIALSPALVDFKNYYFNT